MSITISEKYHIDQWTGLQFNHLTVISEPVIRTNHNFKTARYVSCRCVCGNVKEIRVDYLIHNNVKSCGCLKHKSYTTTHGESGSRLYGVWSNMKDRCYNPNNGYYALYGGRGIKLCPEWEHNYSAFRDWALANGYQDDAGHYQCTIDRIDNNGDYCPENCRWVGMVRQCNNRSSCRYVTRNGRTLSLKQWCQELNMAYKSVHTRIRHGWDVEVALTTPFRGHKEYKPRTKKEANVSHV